MHTTHYGTLVIRPHSMQFVIDELPLLLLCLAGLGVAIAPRELVQPDLDSGRLVAPWGFADTGGTWALCAARGNPDARIPLLADWLRRDLLSAD